MNETIDMYHILKDTYVASSFENSVRKDTFQNLINIFLNVFLDFEAMVVIEM